MPRFVAMEQRYGSLVKGLRVSQRGRDAESRGTSGARWSLFVSFRAGVGTLIEALAARLGDLILRDRRVIALEPTAHRWRIGLADGTALAADAVILTAPAPITAGLICPHDARLAASLEEIRYTSAATVNLAFRAEDFPVPPTSFGFVVPAVEDCRIIAGSFSSLKFAGRAPEGMILMRVFIGGALNNSMMTLDDDAMVAAARGELKALLGVCAAPRFALVRRWPESMPQYAVGHLDRVAAIRSRAAQIRGVILAGAWLDGVGIPDCVRQGDAAAEAAIASTR
jgi:oxygen-dependent protoporphyrinogen oxidase